MCHSLLMPISPLPCFSRRSSMWELAGGTFSGRFRTPAPSPSLWSKRRGRQLIGDLGENQIINSDYVRNWATLRLVVISEKRIWQKPEQISSILSCMDDEDTFSYVKGTFTTCSAIPSGLGRAHMLNFTSMTDHERRNEAYCDERLSLGEFPWHGKRQSSRSGSENRNR